MEANLKHNGVLCYDRSFSQTVYREEIQDSIVPDRLPDIASVISAGGTALIRSKDVGDGRIRIEANVPARVSYYGENDEICCIDVNVPFYVSVESADIAQGAKCVVNMTLTEITAKPQNPRKVTVAASIELRLDCYQQRELMFCAEPEDEQSPVHTRVSAAEATFVRAVTEKTFALTEDFSLEEGSAAIEEILEQDARLEITELKPVGAKLLCKGRARSSILYRSREMRVATAQFDSYFSQIIDLEADTEEWTADAAALLSGLYFDTAAGYDSRSVRMELHAVIQVRAYVTEEIRYLSEAYSNCCELSIRREARELACIRRRAELRENLREQIELPAEVTQLLGYRACISEITEKESEATVRVLLQLVCLREDGRCTVLRRQLNAHLGSDRVPGERQHVCMIGLGDVYAAILGSGAEVRLSVAGEAQILAEQELECITEISYDEDAPLDLSGKPSLVILRLRSTDDLWTVARDNCSTVEAIEAANELDLSGAPWEKLVLIPRVP